MNEDAEKLPLTEHLEELRNRLIRCIIAIFSCFVVAYVFKEKLFEILVAPLIKVMRQEDTLIFTGIPEAFFTYLKVSLLAGIFFAAPFLIYQFWMFVAPGLYKNERKTMIPIIFVSSLFFIGGALFGYFVVFPIGFKFLLGFASETIRPLPSMREYLSFSAKLLVAFGIVFELPIVITFLARLGIVSVPFLKKNRKYAILIFFVGAALLTPPDVVTQALLAMPMIILYEISILGAYAFGRQKAAPEPPDD
ncbi:MAG: twin-arginine translocase subunit TatC [Desulfosalsimonadaceae bacterium]